MCMQFGESAVCRGGMESETDRPITSSGMGLEEWKEYKQ